MAARRRSRGRPTHKPTTTTRRNVERFRAGGMSKDEIARAIGITEPTLTKHYEEELKNGIAKKKGEAINLLWKSANKGTVSAQRRLLELAQLSEAEDSITRPDEKGAEAPKTEPKRRPATQKGKKEQQRDDAFAASEPSPEWDDDLALPKNETAH